MKRMEPMVVVERDFDCTREQLWSALVKPDEMRKWFFDNIHDFKAEKGFYTEFMVDAGERRFLHQWTVIEVIPQEKIAWRWTYAGYPGKGLSVFELSGDADSSHLRLSFPVEEDFPDDVPEFEREACLSGWRYFMSELNNYLAAKPITSPTRPLLKEPFPDN